MRKILTMTLALALAGGSAIALESATTGSQATQATVGVINSKVDVTNNFINSIMKCNAMRKFYAPSDPKKDVNGCVGVGDYDLNMASGTNVNLTDGQVNGGRTAASQYAGYFTGNTHALRGQAGTYGLVGAATGTGGVGVRGDAAATNGWGGYFTGYYGVVGISNGGTWGVESYGYGSGTGSVYIGNDHGNAQLCLNGQCTTSLPSNGYYTIISGYYYSSMSRTNSSGRGMMVMASGGNNPYCYGNYANPYNLNGYVNGNWVTYANDSNIEYSKQGQITFFVPNGSYYTVTSAPYGCSVGYFYVSEALI